MTEDELNALIDGMESRTTNAAAPSSNKVSARTPSAIVRETLAGAGSDAEEPETRASFKGEEAEDASWDDEPVAEGEAVVQDADDADEELSAESDDAFGEMSSKADESTAPEPPLSLEREDQIENSSDEDRDYGQGGASGRSDIEPDHADEAYADAEDQVAAAEDDAASAAETSRGVSLRRSEVAPDAVRATKMPEEKKPRIMLMGEFSAGKSTLMNLLLGEPALPVNATATQLPPVWITKGDAEQPMRVDLEGFEEPVDLASPDIPLADTHYIRLQKNADLLDLCDLIDTPGISDPNMPSETWQRMIQHADVVIWCTHATQAWRQSEAAAWSMMPQKLQKRSLLLLTRFDKVGSDRDRIRVLKRVRSETDELFRDIFPISLTDAIAAGDDKDAFAAAGGESFADALFEVVGLIQRRDTSVQTRPRSQIAPFKLEPEPEPVRVVTPRRVRPRPLTARPLGSRSTALRD